MDNHEHHQELIDSIIKELGLVLQDSEQGVYIYLDDNHKVANENFAQLLGYSSVDEWSSVTKAFTEAFVADESQEALVGAYKDAMEKVIGQSFEVTWKKKNKETIATNVILVPISHDEHLFALHFISPK